MDNPPDKKVRKRFNKLGKQLLVQALDGFYYFEDDEVENALDQALIKFSGMPDWRKRTRIWLWSHQHLRYKICKAGQDVYGTAEE